MSKIIKKEKKTDLKEKLVEKLSRINSFVLNHKQETLHNMKEQYLNELLNQVAIKQLEKNSFKFG